MNIKLIFYNLSNFCPVLRWKSNHFPVNLRQQQELNLALGRLAKKDIDGSNSRFRLLESFVSEELGYPDEENSLFYLALKLGWLNNVGITAESLTKEEKVYAFFHPTFEEYFAALAVNNWDFFLPRNHVNKLVKGKKYRIFEPQWKEVILLWLGREDIAKEEKEKFINALVEFEDGCSKTAFLFIRRTSRKFYQYRAYLLAAAGINEFKEYSRTRTKEIVKQVVDWAFGVGEPPILVTKNLTKTEFMLRYTPEAIAALKETNQTEAIAALVDFIYHWRYVKFSYNDSLRKALEVLEKIAVGNKKAIAALVQLIASAENEETRVIASKSYNAYLARVLNFDDFICRLLKALSYIDFEN
jgi:hypothetical protein